MADIRNMIIAHNVQTAIQKISFFPIPVPLPFIGLPPNHSYAVIQYTTLESLQYNTIINQLFLWVEAIHILMDRGVHWNRGCGTWSYHVLRGHYSLQYF